MTLLQPLSRSADPVRSDSPFLLDAGTLVELLAPVKRPAGPADRIALLPVLRWSLLAGGVSSAVELRVGDGTSYLEICACLRSAAGPQARCLGVDGWTGEDRIYRDLVRRHDPRFAAVSTLRRGDAEAAAGEVSDGSIDFLHIASDPAGSHDPALLGRLVAAWLPKLGRRGVLALSGVADRDGGDGARRVLDSLAAYPQIVFRHDGGLALVAVGAEPPEAVAALLRLDPAGLEAARALFLRLGGQLLSQARTELLERERADRLAAHERDLRVRQDAVAHFGSLLEESRRREDLLRRQADQLQLQLGEMRRSTSWRLTAPLRRLSMLASRLRRRLLGSAAPQPIPVSDPSVGTVPATAPPVDPKQAFKARMAGELKSFLDSGARLALPAAEEPRVSILLILYNQAPLTFGCLQALARTVDLPAEVIVVDNASSDETGALLDRLDGARVIRNAENLHFLRAVNQGAGEARGESLLLLNNDACLRPGALAAADETLWSAGDIGAVGGKIVLLDGTLQEAGSIVWNDGTCLGYGRGRDPGDPEFQFARDVDYCSGAFLLVRRDLFERLGRLDMAFAPAYYEETDFCMRVREAGWRIVYDPRVEILHYEFGSSSSSEQALALQRRNHKIFVERHRATLQARHLPPDTDPLRARMVPPRRGRILIVEDRVPFPSLGAGYPRASHIVTTLHEAGWFVTFYPLLYPDAERAAVLDAFPAGIEFMTGYGRDRLDAFLKERAGFYDTILVSRPHNMQVFGEHHRRHRDLYRDVRIVYDAEAVFAPREAKRMALAGTPLSPGEEAGMLREEMELASPAQSVITVSKREAALFHAAGYRDVHVLGHSLTPQPMAPGFAERRDLLFVGALDDDPSPNTDSLLWFVQEVMPRLDARLGAGWRLMVAGRCAAPRVRALASERVQLLGRVDDLGDLFARARLFIAPTRYAAGLPHKVHEAVSRGLPAVVTGLLASQLDWQDDKEVLVADAAEDFAAACSRLYRDEVLWLRLRETGLESLARDCDPAVFEKALLEMLEEEPAAEARRVP